MSLAYKLFSHGVGDSVIKNRIGRKDEASFENGRFWVHGGHAHSVVNLGY